MYFLYNLIIYLLLPLASPYLLFNRLFRKAEWRQRLGQFSEEDFDFHAPPIWIHAASMGEVVGIAPVVKSFRSRYPDIPILFSTMTTTGNEKATQLFSDAIKHIIIIPLDFDFAIKNVFRHTTPQLLLIAETELWPNLLRIAHQNNCPVMIANGRISDKSFPKYKKIAFFLKTILENISFFCAQTELDATRIIELGLSRERVTVCGNCKFDFPLPKDGKNELREKFKLATEDLIFVAGSTRPGEEEVILNAYQQIRNKFAKNLRLILAPRHLNRLEEVADVIEKFDLSYQQRSQIHTEFTEDIYLLDTMGELSKIYGAADIAFVGGTLFPFGGHNPLEPAMYGVPVIFGKYISNARESYMALQESGGGMQILRNELADVLTMLLSHPERLTAMGEQAKSVILSNRGASDAIVSEVEKFCVFPT